jgi:O-antigen/teichoic acid export membrane protein
LSQQAGAAFFWKGVEQGGDGLIHLIRLVVVARLLTPDDFGLMAIAMAGFVPLLVITDFGMIPALVQRADAAERHYNAAWTVGMVRAATVCAVVFLSAPLIATIFAEPRAVNLIRALSVLPVIEAAASIKLAHLIRTLHFRSLAVARLFQALTNTTISIALVPALGVWALVVGTLAGPAIYVATSYVLAPHRPQPSLDWDAARSLIRYGRWILISGLMSISTALVVRLAISRQLGAAELGLYTLGARLAFLPHELAYEVIGAVTFPIYARLQSAPREAARVFRVILTATFWTLTPLFSLMLVLSPSAVVHILGPRWEGAVPLIRVLALVGLVRIVADACVPVLKGLGRPYKFAAVEGAQALLLVVGVWWFIARFGLIGAGYSWCPAAAAGTLFSIIFVRQHLRDSFVGLVKPAIAIVLASAAGSLIALFIDRSWPGVPGFLLAGVTATAAVLALLWLSNRVFALELARHVARAFPRTAAVLPGIGR